jgi:phenylacetate-CoA ligase
LGRLDFLFKDSAKIEEAQLVQATISSVTVRVVRSTGYSSTDEMSLICDMRRYLGDEIDIQIEYLDVIPREANGKFRQIVSSVFRDKYSGVGGFQPGPAD